MGEADHYHISVIIDLFFRKVVLYRISQNNITQLFTSIYKYTQACRKADEGLIIHSHRGLQYLSHAFQEVLDSHHSVQSLSAPGQSHDNAVAESLLPR